MSESDSGIAPDSGAEPVSRLYDEILRTHEQSLGYVLARAHQLYRQYLNGALLGTGLHMGQVVILASLRAQALFTTESDLTQVRLVQITGIEKSSLVLFLDALEKDGWVERRRHPTDRRAFIVHLTPSGAERFQTVGERLHKYESECLSVLDTGEREQLMANLLRVMRQIQVLEGAEGG